MKNLPLPPRRRPDNFLTGSLSSFRRNLLEFMSETAAEVGDVAAYRLGPRQVVLVSHPDAIEQVLVHDNRQYHKHYALNFLRPLLGNGLLNSEDEYWLRQRRLMQPEFLRHRLETYGRGMVDRTQSFIADWKHGQVCDLHAEMMRLTLAIVAQTLLDVEVSAGVFHEVEESLEIVLEDFRRRFQAAIPLPPWVPTPRNMRVNRATRRLKDIVSEIIAQRRSEATPGGDLLSRLIRARDEGDGAGMSDEALRDEVMTLFLAGHETTAVALSWTWMLLAQHPNVEAQLHQELGRVLGGRTPGVADLPNLKFAECVIRESMRLFPPVYAIGRMPLTDVEIGGFRVSRNTAVVLPQWVVHRDSRWYDNPLAFQPQRWLTPRSLPKYAYFPFGGGPRVCIGNQFAMIEATLVLATIAQQFRFDLDPSQTITPWPTVTLRPLEGLTATIASRNSIPNATEQANQANPLSSAVLPRPIG
jgi:cytochrome P450